MSDAVGEVLSWLNEHAPEKARAHAQRLEVAGLAGSIRYGEKGDETVPVDKGAALLALTLDALDALVERFDAIHQNLVRRIRMARRLRMGAAVATALSGSATLAAISAQAPPFVSLGLSALTLLAALATVLAEYNDRKEAFSEFTASVERLERARVLIEDLRHGPALSEEASERRLNDARSLPGSLRAAEKRLNLTA